jgi:hypothetical protein
MQKLIIAIIACGVVAAAFYYARNPEDMFATTASPGFACAVDADCMLVEKSMCGSVASINRGGAAEWAVYDRLLARRSKKEGVVCAPRAGRPLTDYAPACVKKHCQAVLISE